MNHKFDKIPNNFEQNWPMGEDLYYQCKICEKIIPTIVDGECRCGNLYVDHSSGRAGANMPQEILLLRLKHNQKDER